MTDTPTPLERRLRAARYKRAATAAAKVLDTIGVPEQSRRLLDLSAVEEIWAGYLSRLREGGDARERWPADRIDDVRSRLAALGEAACRTTMVWLALTDNEPVGFEVPAHTMLGAALDGLVSRANDLMLTTIDLADGICIELNHLNSGDEYEVVTWGRFAPWASETPCWAK